MKWVQFRPKFQFDLSESSEEVIAKLLAEHEHRRGKENFVMSGEYGELHIPASEHRIWSPYLTFYVYRRGEQDSLFGRFSPRLHILAFVWFVYLLMTFTAFFSCMFAGSQWMMGEPPWMLVVTAFALMVIMLLYFVAHIGQQWSADQMSLLKEQLKEMLQAAKVDYQECD